MSKETLHFADGWGDTKVLPEGWICKMLVAGETLNFFLQNGISKLKENVIDSIFFFKKKVSEPWPMSMDFVESLSIHGRVPCKNYSYLASIEL